MPPEHSQHEETVAARVFVHDLHPCHRRCQPAPTEEQTARQRYKLFARDLQSGEGLTFLLSRLRKQAARHAMLRRGASLRGAFALFLEKANTSQWPLPICL